MLTPVPNSIPRPSAGQMLRRFPSLFREPLRYFSALAEDYGPVVHLPFGNQDFYLLNDPALVQQVLLTKSASFEKFPQIDPALGLFGEGLLTSEEPRHMRQRRWMQPAFHHERIRHYADTVVACTRELRPPEHTDLASEMHVLTLEIICQTMFGASAKEEAHEISRLLEIVMRMLAQLVTPLGRIKVALPLPETRAYFAALKRLDEILFGMIEARRARPDSGDLLGMLLETKDEDGNNALSTQELRDELMTIFVAGHETTSNHLAWTWYLLGTHPEVQKQLEQELDALDDIGADDYPKLPYSQAVIKESMRLYPSVWIMGRRALEPMSLGTMEAKAGDTFLVCQYTLHRRPELYSDAATFLPERWLTGWKPQKFAYLPFGAGPRLCIGERFAMMEAVLILAILAKRYRVELVSQVPPEPLARMTLSPKGGLPVKLYQRYSTV